MKAKEITQYYPNGYVVVNKNQNVIWEVNVCSENNINIIGTSGSSLFQAILLRIDAQKIVIRELFAKMC